MPTARNVPGRPLLIYDGDCGFCKYWVRHWQGLTGPSVTYAPYQEVGEQYPAADGRIASGAEAALLCLSHASGKGWWLTLYRRVPAFAVIAEDIYAFVGSHRSALYRPSRVLWGPDNQPPRFDLVAWLFLRAMGLIYLIAFVSFGVQALGLIGSHGILPLSE